MKKIFTFLAGIFVCALVANGAAASSRKAKTTTLSKQTSTVAVKSPGSTVVNMPAAAAKTAFLSVSQTMKEIADSKSLLKTQPVSSGAPRLAVTLAALDPATSQINLLSVAKESFLTKGADLLATTQLGNQVQLHVVRANGVNTAVTVTDIATGGSFVPLAVAYPIEKKGAQTEMAYYTSGHPALLSAEIVSAGEGYVATMLNAAAERLAARGVSIAPDIVNIAEHLCVVEHTDHQRFLNEDRSRIYPEIFSLYALNQGDTFRYSISSAGAGGMIQMIPRTYAGIREHHRNVDLESDFVRAMSDHTNALEAMLLYINDTWDYLQKSSEVQDALTSGVASKSELLAAGYNSNPMRLPQYLKNGGHDWRNLIPAETQMYLTIYSSVDGNVQFRNHPDQNVASEDVSTRITPAVGEQNAVAAFISWLSNKLETSGRAVFARIAQ